MQVLILKSPQLPVQENVFFIGSTGDEADALRELEEFGFRRHGTIEGRFNTMYGGREWIAEFKDVGDTAIGWHLRNAPSAR